MGRKLLWWCLPPVLLMTMLLCVCAGSVPLSPGETLQILWRGLTGTEAGGSGEAIILRVRLPRVLCVALTGASLSLCGAAMQGLLRNPLADGSTLGVSSGASNTRSSVLCWGCSSRACLLRAPWSWPCFSPSVPWP